MVFSRVSGVNSVLWVKCFCGSIVSIFSFRCWFCVWLFMCWLMCVMMCLLGWVLSFFVVLWLSIMWVGWLGCGRLVSSGLLVVLGIILMFRVVLLLLLRLVVVVICWVCGMVKVMFVCVVRVVMFLVW